RGLECRVRERRTPPIHERYSDHGSSEHPVFRHADTGVRHGGMRHRHRRVPGARGYGTDPPGGRIPATGTAPAARRLRGGGPNRDARGHTGCRRHAGTTAAGQWRIDVGERIRTEPLQIDELVQQTRAPEAGSLAIFAGTVRCENDAKEVVGLEYTAYEPLAERELERLERDTEQRFGVTVCRLQHRIGPLQIGDTSVLVVVRAPHRAEAFAAARHALDTLKQTVPG